MVQSGFSWETGGYYTKLGGVTFELINKDLLSLPSKLASEAKKENANVILGYRLNYAAAGTEPNGYTAFATGTAAIVKCKK